VAAASGGGYMSFELILNVGFAAFALIILAVFWIAFDEREDDR